MTPPLLRNPPPIPAETAQPSTLDMILQALGGLRNEMDGMNANMNNKMDGMAQTVREEMENMGAGLQDGLEKLKIGNGELRRATEIRETCRVTEKVTETVTQRKKLNGGDGDVHKGDKARGGDGVYRDAGDD